MSALSPVTAVKEPVLPNPLIAEANGSRGMRFGHFRRPVGRKGEKSIIKTGHQPALIAFTPAWDFADFPEAGGYPVPFLKRAYATLGVTDPSKVLHLCSGSVRIGVTVDIRPDVGASVVCDARHTPFPDHSFDWIMCDPPYSVEWCQRLYGLPQRTYPTPRALMTEATRLLRPGGRVGVLHYQVAPPPNYRLRRPREVQLVGVWGVVSSVGSQIRAWTVYEKLAPAIGALVGDDGSLNRA